MLILFLDDMEERVPVLREGEEVVYVRNPDKFKLWILKHGPPDVISFDHDLSYTHYTNSRGYDDLNPEWTGTDCARWLVQYGYEPKHVIIHSWNRSGAQRIADCFAGTNTTVRITPFSATHFLTDDIQYT